MLNDANSARSLIRLRHMLTLGWAVAWVVGLAALATVAIKLSAELRSRSLDSELEIYATTAYGLTWFDDQGVFHPEIFEREPKLAEAPFDIWILEPDSSPVVHLEPSAPHFAIDSLARIAAHVVRTQAELFTEGQDTRGTTYRLHAVPTYQDDRDDSAIAAVIVIGNPQPGRAAHRAFVRHLSLIALGLGALGIAVGDRLARFSLRPVLAALAQREQFLAAAAHELRTPLAALQGVCDSAIAGDEPSAPALERMSSLIARTGHTVDDLLLFARLDDGSAELDRQPVRLDLLVEAELPEDTAISLVAEASVAEVDPRLARVAIRNLIDNAATHGGALDGDLRVQVGKTEVTVEDLGPGFPSQILAHRDHAFGFAPAITGDRGKSGHQGVGLGLAITRLIAELHGGELVLENRVEGGARAILRFGSTEIR